MKKNLFMMILIFAVSLLCFSSCKSKKEHEGRWRVIDEQVYEPDFDKKTVFTSLAEFEKLIYAPFSYFEKEGGIRTFIQKMSYVTEKQLEDEKRSLKLEENVELFADESGNYIMSFINNRNEGYDFIWKDNFLYRRQLGGEFSKTFSMGEHRHYREVSFGSIPSIYTVLRNHAEIEDSSRKTHGGIKGTELKIVFRKKPSKKNKLPEKRYLQNLFGTEEMKDDNIVKEFAAVKKESVNGTFILFVDDLYNVIFMKIDAGFHLVEDGVDFKISGERILSKEAAEKIEVPEYEEEYHRRTLDAAVNIMKETGSSKNNDTEIEKDNE